MDAAGVTAINGCVSVNGSRRTRPTAIAAVVGLVAVVSALGLTDLGDVTSRDVRAALWLDRGGVLAGEPWRLLTVALVHVSAAHLAANLLGLVVVGWLLEHLVGRVRFVLVWLAATAASSAIGLAFLAGPIVGASGGLFGSVGAGIVMLFGVSRPRDAWPLTVATVLAFLVGVALDALQIMPVAHAVHLGGVVAGTGLGLLLRPALGAAESR
jgi:membrane associated rhomboid family serine protease